MIKHFYIFTTHLRIQYYYTVSTQKSTYVKRDAKRLQYRGIGVRKAPLNSP